MDADELNETATDMQCVDGEGATSSLRLGDARIIAIELAFENFTCVEAETDSEQLTVAKRGLIVQPKLVGLKWSGFGRKAQHNVCYRDQCRYPGLWLLSET